MNWKLSKLGKAIKKLQSKKPKAPDFPDITEASKKLSTTGRILVENLSQQIKPREGINPSSLFKRPGSENLEDKNKRPMTSQALLLK